MTLPLLCPWPLETSTVMSLLVQKAVASSSFQRIPLMVLWWLTPEDLGNPITLHPIPGYQSR